MQLHIALTVDVDEDAYAREYGQTRAEMLADAPKHVSALIAEVVEDRAKLMGTFTLVRCSVTNVDADRRAGQLARAPKLVDRLPQPDSRFYWTADPRVLVARWGACNWRTLIEYADGWDHTGPPHDTKEAAIADAPAVANRWF